MVEAGVPRKRAEMAVSRKLEQLSVEAHAKNYAHAVDFARLLGMPFMNIHMPLDEIGRRIYSQRRGFRPNGASRIQKRPYKD